MFEFSLAETAPTEFFVSEYPRLEDGMPFPNDPDKIRWRAAWNKDYSGEVLGIELRCYPVSKLTPKGAWIDPFAWREHQSAGVVWHMSRGLDRWVSNDGGQAWAKRTKEEAMDSLTHRFNRWGPRLRNDVAYFVQCAAALKAIHPDKAKVADLHLTILRDYVSDAIERKDD